MAEVLRDWIDKNQEKIKSREELKQDISKAFQVIKNNLKAFDWYEGKIIEKWIKTMELRINMLNDEYMAKILPKLTDITNNLNFLNISLDNNFKNKIVGIFDEENPASILNWLN